MTLSSDRFQLGDWLVDPSLSRVTNSNKTVHLEPRAMEVLVYLAGRADELVSKQDLIDHVWQAEVVAHGSLTGIIAQLPRPTGAPGPHAACSVHGQGVPLAG